MLTLKYLGVTAAKCRICGEQVYRNAKGETLRHTTPAIGGKRTDFNPFNDDRVEAEICPGSTPGARP
jgi:hypothetical protein